VITLAVGGLTPNIIAKTLVLTSEPSILFIIIIIIIIIGYLQQTRKYMFLPVFVCLSVSKITQKRVHGFG